MHHELHTEIDIGGFDTNTRAGFEAMNIALKARAEAFTTRTTPNVGP